MSRRYRTNDGEWNAKRDRGTDELPLFAGETGIDTPRQPAASGEAERDRVITALGDEEKRRDWIDRIHTALVANLARNQYAGTVSANEARAVHLTFDDADPSIDFRFLAALWRKKGWVLLDFNATSLAPGTHARRIGRYSFCP